MERFYIGTAAAIEAEYGQTDLFGNPWVVASAYNGEFYCVEGFSTREAAKASLAEIENRSAIGYVG